MGEDRTGRDHPSNRPTTGRRLTVSEAADVLGISVEAVRGRIKRGTIYPERDGKRLYVILDADQTATGRDQGDDQTSDRPELVDLLRAQVEDLRADRDAWRDQARRSDYMAQRALDRTNELEGRLRELEPGPPDPDQTPEPREAPATEAQQPEGSEPRSDTGGVQEGIQKPWWRRVFGG